MTNDEFLSLAKELRAMGATRIEAPGYLACFTPPQHDAPSRKPQEPERKLTPEARELRERAIRISGRDG